MTYIERLKKCHEAINEKLKEFEVSSGSVGINHNREIAFKGAQAVADIFKKHFPDGK